MNDKFFIVNEAKDFNRLSYTKNFFGLFSPEKKFDDEFGELTGGKNYKGEKCWIARYPVGNTDVPVYLNYQKSEFSKEHKIIKKINNTLFKNCYKYIGMYIKKYIEFKNKDSKKKLLANPKKFIDFFLFDIVNQNLPELYFGLGDEIIFVLVFNTNNMNNPIRLVYVDFYNNNQYQIETTKI